MVSPRHRRPIHDARGQVAIIFALLALPIMLITALAIDSARQVNTDRHLDIATDLASLAAVRAMEDASMSDAAIEAVAETYYIAQLESSYGDVNCDAPDVVIDRTAKTVSVEGSCAVPTVFGLYSSAPETVAVTQGAVAESDVTVLEISLVLDVSASMIGARGDAMKDAAKNFVSSLLDVTTADRGRNSSAPSPSSVNAGSYGNRARGRLANDDGNGDGTDTVCVRERGGVEAPTDAPPMIGQFVRENTSTRVPSRCLDQSVLPLANDTGPMHLLIDGLTPEHSGSGGQIALAWAC